jgi:ABC-type transport system involved in cytochrome c biogenesis permease subunit
VAELRGLAAHAPHEGLAGTVAAWWALAGLGVTTFAFLGVNMFLSGLHSYGEL